jgi:DegV family protein with EDD domain
MIKIVTDSTAYVTSEYADAHDIKVVPLYVITKNNTVEEGFPGSFDNIFESIMREEEAVKSSQPSPESFKNVFEKILKDGNEVLCITISSSLSGTYNSAILAAKMCESEKITVIDSRAAAQLTLLGIEKAVEMAESGASRQEIAEEYKRISDSSAEIFVPVTLKYLIRGGRIGGVNAIIGSLLHVKPLLSFKDGVLTAKRKIIGMGKAIKAILGEIPKDIKKIYVMKIYKSEYFAQLLQDVKNAFPHINVKEAEVGPVVGAHVGPGTIGVAYTY